MLQQLAQLKSALGPDGWFVLVALLAGTVARLTKRYSPKWLIPYTSLIVGALLTGGAAIALGQPLGAALVLGLGAGGSAVGAHEAGKVLLSKLFGAELSDTVMGKGKAKK